MTDQATILNQHALDIAQTLLPSQKRAIFAIRHCRTATLGGHVFACPHCQDRQYLFRRQLVTHLFYLLEFSLLLALAPAQAIATCLLDVSQCPFFGNHFMVWHCQPGSQHELFRY